MTNLISTSQLSFSEQALGTNDRVKLNFLSKLDIATLSENVVLVGQAVQAFADSLSSGSDLQAALSDLLPIGNQAKGWTGSTIAKVAGKKTKIHVAMTSTEASRHNNPFRADAVTKSLVSALPDLVSEAAKGTSKVVTLICAVPSVAAVPSISFSVARALPRFTRKTERGKDADSSKPVVTVNTAYYVESGEAVPEATLSAISTVAESIRMSQTLTDAPPNELNVSTYVDFVKKVVEGLPGVGMKVIRGKDLETQGFGGIWNVGKGNTTNLPAMVVLSLKGTRATGSEDKSVVLVGKGIVYDSGGLAIKPRDGMCNMKADMAGSAAILSAFVAVARMGGLKTGESLHSILCLAENSIGPDSFRNDDIIRMYSGMTVEVNNTDAEGRLVLADGCAYAAKHLSPRIVIDMATLTGAQGIATGQNHAAALCAFDDDEAAIVAAGKKSGDLAFPIVYCPEFHRPNYKSEIADMKNSVSNRMDATSSASGWFIYDHMNAAGYTGPWIHMDMAGPAVFGSAGAGSGYGVGLICAFLGMI